MICAETEIDTPAFSIGEQLNFKIYFEFILGGVAVMEVAGVEEIDSSKCFKIVSRARSNRTVDMFYKVRDQITCWRDIDGGFSRRYVKNLREGKYRDNKWVDYKPDSALAYLYRDNSEHAETLSVEGSVQDVLSAFYEMRTRPLEVGKSVFIDVHDINKQYKLEVKVIRRERIQVPAGEFTCLVIEPGLMSSGIFRKEGKMQIWVTDDQYHMPVLMKSKLYFGAVWAKLSEYTRGNN